jgi:hypothetical protein
MELDAGYGNRVECPGHGLWFDGAFGEQGEPAGEHRALEALST